MPRDQTKGFLHASQTLYQLCQIPRKQKGPEGMEDTRRIRASESTEQGAYELTEMETANTGPTRVFTKSFEDISELSSLVFLQDSSVYKWLTLIIVPSLGALFVLFFC